MDPVKDKFFGRERILREIVQGVLAGQPASFSLVGSKLLGKSEILRYLGSEDGPLLSDEMADWRPLRFQDGWRVIAINIDCDRHAAQEELLQDLYDRLVYYVREEARIDLDWQQVESQTNPLRRVWQVARQLNTLDYRLIVLMDNFDSVFERQLLSLDSVDELRPLTLELALIVATEQPLHDLDRELAASPLFNVMTQLFVGLIEPEAARNWINAYGTLYPAIPEMSSQILEATGAHPYLLHRLGEILAEVQQMLPPGMGVSDEHFPLIRLRLAEHGRLLFVRLWNKLEKPPGRVQAKFVMTLLDHLLAGPMAVNQITREQFSTLNWMINQAIVTYGAEGYQLFSPLLSEFITGRLADAPSASTPLTPPPPATTFTPANNHIPTLEQAEFYKNLTKIESSLLRYFQANSQTIIPPEQLLADVWKRPDASPRRVQEAIRRLRLQLEKAAPPIGVIENDRGRGYRFVPNRT